MAKPRQTERKRPSVTLESLERIFTIPEGDDSTLAKIERDLSQNLLGFLKDHIVATELPPAELERDFVDTEIREEPIFVSEQADFLLNKVVAQSVHVASPSFVGHMTSAMPYFMLPLAKIMMGLNQNLVKIETSKAFTPLERQVLGMLHRLIYDQPTSFYQRHPQDHECALGTFCSDGTIANLTSLWVALNRLMPPKEGFTGVGEEGLLAAVSAYDYRGLTILVSKRGHYSLKKAANLLGIGRQNLRMIAVDENNRIRLDLLKSEIQELKKRRIGIVAVIGIAGTTETGSVDPLQEMAAICKEEGLHFHVDAAWGGPTLFSKQHRHLLQGIQEADSVILDAHKQLYVPMGAGMALFKDHHALGLTAHHAQYIIRKGSRDLGRWTVEGSRPGMALLVHSGLRIMGRGGYGMLIDLGIAKAKSFAAMIEGEEDFELISHPELNLLTYRYVPADVKAAMATASSEERVRLNEHLNQLTINLQKEQREAGKTFVSRTVLEPVRYGGQAINVFRVVLANPLTTLETLKDMLLEQRELAKKLLKGPEVSMEVADS